MKGKISIVEKHFLVTLLIFSLLGLWKPQYFSWSANAIHPLLALIAFCVGLTLKSSSYKNVWQNKKLIIPILAFKYSIAPLLTFITCSLAAIPTPYIIGLVTLTCCPAANTGNIMCYLAKGNTAMIVATTVTGALLAPVVTPIIIYLLLHKIVHIQFSDILLTITTGIALPIIAGILVNSFFSKFVDHIKPAIPSIGILAVSTIVSAILSQHTQQIIDIDIKIPLLYSFLIVLFLSLGFLFSKMIKTGNENAIAMSFEVGTFDGVLGILLTLQIIGTSGTLSVVLFAVLNLIIGSIAAQIFSAKNKQEVLT